MKANDKVDPLKRPNKCHIKVMWDRIVQYSVRANRVYTVEGQLLRKTNSKKNITFK